MFVYKNVITTETGKRSGRPCIRGMRITVEDIFRYLASEISIEEIIADFPELTKQDILTAIQYAAGRQYRTFVAT